MVKRFNVLRPFTTIHYFESSIAGTDHVIEHYIVKGTTYAVGQSIGLGFAGVDQKKMEYEKLKTQFAI